MTQTQELIEKYHEIVQALRKKGVDEPVVATIVDQIGKDLRVEAMREERDAARQARFEAAGTSSDKAVSTTRENREAMASQKQIDWLRDLGIAIPQNLTRAQASEMLDEAIAARQAAR